MASRSQWRLTPGLWLLLKLAAVIPIVVFMGKLSCSSRLATT